MLLRHDMSNSLEGIISIVLFDCHLLVMAKFLIIIIV